MPKMLVFIQMKILINGYYKFLPGKESTFSGPRNLLELFLKYLDTNGHTFTALVLRGKKIKDEEVELERVPAGKNSWLVATLRLNTPDVSGAKEPGTPASLEGPMQRITKIIAAEKPDIVFINGMSISNWFIIKAAETLKIPVIVNHLGLWFKEIIEYGATPAGQEIMREMEKDLVRLSSKNIFLSKLSFREFNEHLIEIPKDKINFIPNPVDEIYLDGAIEVSRELPLKIGIVARWDPIKNHKAVLQLAKAAQEQNLPWEFYSVTTIHKEYSWSKDIEKEYAQYIHILPPMIPSELKKFYQNMNILILPSNFDVSPTVVMEAIMQKRMTLISSMVGLIDTYKENDASDFVVDFSNTNNVINAIQKHGYTEPPKKLFDYIKKHYQGKYVYNKYVELAKSLIKQP